MTPGQNAWLQARFSPTPGLSEAADKAVPAAANLGMKPEDVGHGTGMTALPASQGGDRMQAYMYAQLHPSDPWGAHGPSDHTMAEYQQLTTPPPKDEYQASRRQVDRKDRLAMLRPPDEASTPTTPGSTQHMTQAEYDALTPQQRSAVDFNGALVAAVRKDLNNQAAYSANLEADKQGGMRTQYKDEVKNMFGEGRGSKTYAPETVSLLRSIGFTDQNADLDDFLHLRAAISADDLGKLANPIAQITQPQNDQVQLSATLANDTARLQQALSKGNQLMATFARSVQNVGSDNVRRLGGIPSDSLPTRPGWGDDPLSANFQQVFDGMVNKANDPKVGLAYAANTFTPEQYDAFVNYIDTRTKQAQTYGTPLGTDPATQYRNAQQVRKLFDLGGE
jgi:hypothetical protein